MSPSSMKKESNKHMSKNIIEDVLVTT
uniref:Uncharacterized protein n=1 Tax=Arundo donax TaxID=35708 RepID=A0A0A9HVL0_ARUDO